MTASAPKPAQDAEQGLPLSLGEFRPGGEEFGEARIGDGSVDGNKP